MNRRFQFSAVLAAFLTAGLMCSYASGQTPGDAAVQERRAERQQILQQQQQLRQQQQQLRQQQQQLRQQQQQLRQQQQNGQNAMRPGENAGNRPGAGNLNNRPPTVFERLQDMPPDRQEQFLQNNQRFQNLPPQQQAQIRQRLQTWNKLAPGQQQEFRERQRVWEQMTPEQQGYVRQTLMPRWQQLPPPRRRAILQRLHSLRDLSESDRQVKLNDPSFVEGLNTEDRETLTQLAHLHVGTAPDPPGM
jgi:hypothetical protein